MKQEDAFGDSCVEVVRCYLREEYGQVAGDTKDYLESLVYNTTVYEACTSVVENTYKDMRLKLSSLATLQDINYGDDMFINADEEDSPYDLLIDVEVIGNVLFAHNDPASEIHAYSILPWETYVDNDPTLVTPYNAEPPTGNNLEVLPPSNGYDPQIDKQDEER